MPQVSLSTSTNFDGDRNALVEDQANALTVRFDLDEPAPEGGLKVYVDSEVEQIINRLDLPGFAFSPTLENIDAASLVTNFDNSGFALTIEEGATFGTFTIDVFDNLEPDTFLPETFDGRVEAALSLRTQDEVEVADQNDITDVSEYTIDSAAASSTVIFADEASQLADMPEPPTPEPPMPEGLQVSLFTGPDYLIEDEGTVSAHAFLATNGVIPDGGLVVSVDAPNLSEFDLESVSVEGGEIAAVRDGGFDLRMTEYTALVNLAIADDGETETGETASFSLATGEGYEINEDYSGGSFELVDTRSDIPQGITTEPSDIISKAIDTRITAENPSFSTADSIYFDIGNRYLNDDGTYTYVDYNEDVDLYKLELSAGDTIAVETFEVEGNQDVNNRYGSLSGVAAFDAEGNRLTAAGLFTPAAPDKLFGGGVGGFNEDGTVNENETDTYLEFTASKDGVYYVGVSSYLAATQLSYGTEEQAYDIETPASGDNNRVAFGRYEIEIDLLTPDNPRKTGMPTAPVSNLDVINPPTLSLGANPITVDSEGNFTNAVVEFVESDGISGVNFTIQTEGEIPEGGIELVLNSNANLFDYISYLGQDSLPSTIGGQSLGAFYNEDGIPTGIRLRIEEPTMTVNLERANRNSTREFQHDTDEFYDQFEGLETDGAEDVTFFLQPGDGYEVSSELGETNVTYYDSVNDVPPPTSGGNSLPEVGVTISETELVESEGNETTLTFTLSEPPPLEGVTVFLDSEDDPLIGGSVLGQFNVLEAEVDGGDFPTPNSDSSGFFFTITEQTASITLSAFDELTVVDDPLVVQEGILDLNFSLQPQAGSYTIDPNASGFGLTIADNADSQIQVSLIASTKEDPESTALIESQGTVSIHTFSLSSPPPEEGLTVSVNAPDLSEFDLDAIEVIGGTITNLQNEGFDLTIIEREAIINLPVLDDGVDEGSETATFTLAESDTYLINQAATEATFGIADTPDQVVGISAEIERNSTIPPSERARFEC
ncbi:pre-peptidase C-terminal domain-containing protein [cf. Phormidesmis sp. LEGE 11477]|uniref:pre-peptidase C-terminal domain-containing protein n=1 Tax=cf. Phormidesmis sp. LEGE 11477 TaxID=1828680 RepID=UPI001D157E55|nr:pre-peptidase C-terminal domain-containing protein [cf. Phormidesmis sp. LEGE 11477]